MHEEMQKKLERTFQRLIILTYAHRKKLGEMEALLEEKHRSHNALEQERKRCRDLQARLDTARTHLQNSESELESLRESTQLQIRQLQEELRNERQVHMDLNAELNREMETLRKAMQRQGAELESKTMQLQQLASVMATIHNLTSADKFKLSPAKSAECQAVKGEQSRDMECGDDICHR